MQKYHATAEHIFIYMLCIWEAWYKLVFGNIINRYRNIMPLQNIYLYASALQMNLEWVCSNQIWYVESKNECTQKHLLYFLFIIIYINSYMFRSYTGMVFFLIKYLRRSVNFLLLKTILATLNEEIELLKQFSLKHFYQN